ncbi:hypothetical protein MNB_SV-10-1299 [hydrothermal vent metagenome]|uniref:Polymerase nucleotidyl transferase domain-containing protein n=1 Tax=hydrothermal vent metagenome TaxID=652676 RepID=A0A1W1BM62_9ZZZZ
MDVVSVLKKIKPQLENEGFMIDGIVGSYAYGDHTAASDVDILYHVDETFVRKHHGFATFSRIAEIKQLLAEKLHKEVDLIASRGLSETAKKYMLSRVLNV